MNKEATDPPIGAPYGARGPSDELEVLWLTREFGDPDQDGVFAREVEQ